jgi:uncharacterized protein (TIGR00645 family)
MHMIIARMVVLSRFVMVPLLAGLAFALVLLCVAFYIKLWHLLTHLLSASDVEIAVGLLGLIDLTLIGSLMVIVVLSGYENFVEKVDPVGTGAYPGWMTKVSFPRLKQTLFASMMAISGVTLLKALMELEISVSEIQVRWLVIANIIFMLSYAVLTITDHFAGGHDDDDMANRSEK